MPWEVLIQVPQVGATLLLAHTASDEWIRKHYVDVELATDGAHQNQA